MSTRTPAAPPDVPGLEVTAIIGTGGFADVFLVNEISLHRQVALKVLRNQPSSEERLAFEAEAHVMAQLSTHPAIVPIYQIGVAKDGRPFLTMEYCRGRSLAERYRQAPLPVAEALEIGIQVCAAVETAHRAGVLHRDIKPANILTTSFGVPKLSDFGIAHVLTDGAAAVSGFSVPWSPPEAFRDDAVPDARSDVWSLAATIYTLLAGRSPFERAGSGNDTATLMDRIINESVPTLARADATDALRAVLARGMADRLDHRYGSAIALARALQEVQVGLHLATTRIDVLDASADRVVDEDPDRDQLTSVRPITVIPQVPDVIDDATLAKGITPSAPVPRAAGPSFEHQGVAPAPTPPTPDAPTGPPPVDDAGQGARGGSRLLVGLVLGAAAVALVVGVLAVLGDDADEQAQVERIDTGTAQEPLQDTVDVPVPPTPTELRGVLDGRTAVFTWTVPESQEGDTFRWTLAGDGGEPSYTLADTPRAQVDVPPGRRPCIVVSTVRAGQQSDPSPLTCAEQP